MTILYRGVKKSEVNELDALLLTSMEGEPLLLVGCKVLLSIVPLSKNGSHVCVGLSRDLLF